MQTALTVSDWQPLLLGIGIGGVSILIIYAFIFSRTKRSWQDALSGSELQLERVQSENSVIRQQLDLQQNEVHQCQLKVTRLEERLLNLNQQHEHLVSDKHQLERKLEQALFQLADRNEVIAETEARLESERVAHSDKLKMLEEARSQLKQEFQNLANRIFDEKAQRFTQSNTENMGHLLNPLKEQIGEFKRRVEDAYDKEAKDRRALYEQIGHLKQLNQQMSADAINLTNALKGENKTQGNWGEVVLERALEESGLRKGYEFELQVSVTQENRRYQPDAIIRLPDGKDVIVDAKVSLTAYEQYCSVEPVEEKTRLLKEHLLSIRGHIKGLGDKAYQSLDGVRSLDFVLLFIPVEGAFLLALEKEPGLFKDAFDRNIMLVSPSTLMVTLRTIHNIWRYEHQNQNAKEIARRGGELHDKFVGFVESVDEIGRNLNRTQQAFDTAHKRLSSGRGNLINQVAMLKELGADGKKALSADLIEKASQEDC
ncbi:DNA recombination protein RmuC [uncultured Neptuniibacter sp.]|uniref:DNA recombination protein RmuC n=1 Tax=uncultured Neptuniibacter sp. TaxID=502143 RepID=UPI002633DF41|nr:DNA recombination protein RmuC [uncultured Neptuniibacter sp.]